MLKIVKENKPRYRVADSKTKKTIIVNEVIDLIESRGARFIKQTDSDSGAWVEVAPVEKHRKVCHCLREEKHNEQGSTGSSSSESVSQESPPATSRQAP